jgi:hypothetical protein
MHKRIETIADDTQYSHSSRASARSSWLTGRKRPLIVVSTCQSEIKRTLRRARRPANNASWRGFRTHCGDPSMQMVNAGFPQAGRYGFEMVDAPRRFRFRAKTAINRKFTSNRIKRIFREFSEI